MAEGWARQLMQGSPGRVVSAGIEAHGLNPLAVQVMGESGIDISRHTSNTIDVVSVEDFDLVVTVCGDADEHCPLLPAGTEKRHWPLADPARLTGTEQEILAGFRASRDEIRARVTRLLDDFS